MPALQSTEREQLNRKVVDAWDAYQRDGLHATADEADVWLSKLEAGDDTDPPACHA